MVHGRRVIAVLPAYNAALTLRQTVADIPRDIVDEIILVDDGSTDDTAAIARSLQLTVVVHAVNKGYGGNQKTCYATALAHGADIVVMVHPDHQYDPHFVTQLVDLIGRGEADAAFGSRMLHQGGALQGGMPRWKYLANILLTKVANVVLGLQLSEYHSGFRAYSRQVLEAIALEKNSDNFVFDTEIIIQVKHAGFRIREIPIPTRYFKEASSIGLRQSIIYGTQFLITLGHYMLHRTALHSDARFSFVRDEE